MPRLVLQPLLAPVVLNRTWAIGFATDALYDGRSLRTLNVLNEGNREVLAIAVAISPPGARVASVLEQLVAIHGGPRAVRCDNAPEFISEALRDRSERRGVALHFVQPGKPNPNAYIERGNRTYRREVLNARLFAVLDDVRAETVAWLTTYSTERAHDSLGEVPRLTFLPRPITTPAQSSC